MDINIEVPPGPCSMPLSFLVSINVLQQAVLNSTVAKHADETSVAIDLITLTS